MYRCNFPDDNTYGLGKKKQIKKAKLSFYNRQLLSLPHCRLHLPIHFPPSRVLNGERKDEKERTDFSLPGCVQNVMNVLKLAPENEHQKKKKNADYLCLLRFATSPHLSSVCTMSECSAPNFVYSRRKQQGNSVAVFSAEALVSTKRGGEDCLSVVSSDAPSVAVNELYVACQSEHTNGDHIMPSTVCNREPGVLKSESINGCSLVKELGSDRTSKNSRHNFVYRRKKLNGNSISVFSSEAPCLSVVSSDSPSFAVKERDVASQSKQTNRDPFMPSTVCNREPGVLKSESINGCSLVKELGSDRTSKNSGQNFVYKRKKLHGNSIAVFSAEAPCLSVVSSDSPSFAVREQDVASQSKQTNRDPFMPSTVCKGGHCIFKSESINGCFPPQEHGFNEASKSMSQKIIEVDSINDSCSSSKSDTELGLASSQTEVDNSGECSSSSVMAAEVSEEDMSEKDLCVSEEGVSDSSASGSYQLCKICSHPESTLKMLICDNCEEAFHLFCCNPRVKRIPLDDWFCHSCSKKRHKILKETISRSRYMIGEKGRCGSSSRGETNPIVLMLRDTGPYRTGVRCGKGFQAEVPEWSGPITNGIDIDTMAEPLEMSPSYFVSSTELNSNKSSKLSSIGNWLQCRVVVDSAGESANGTICGKWRRAPLFEVQTDDWECFCSVLWDPVHADCAVPQELDTDQVLLQLKYIQMLRPQLEAKRRKLEHRKNDDKSMDVVNWQQWKSWQPLQVNDDDSVDVVNQEQLNSQQQHHANDDNSMNVVYHQQQQQNGTIMYRRYTHGCKKGSYQN